MNEIALQFSFPVIPFLDFGGLCRHPKINWGLLPPLYFVENFKIIVTSSPSVWLNYLTKRVSFFLWEIYFY